MIKIAIIGCGAITERIHLPVLADSDEFTVYALVDSNAERARHLAAQYTIPLAVQNYQEIADKVEAAVIAVPHHLHADIATDLMNKGIDVLVEKPLALTDSDCDTMIEAAQRNNKVLLAGYVRRYYPNLRFVKRLIDGNVIGNIRKIDMREGGIFSWGIKSDFTFKKDLGGGVLSDIGSHVLDIFSWWFGEAEVVDYFDDAMGGVEANAEIHLKTPNGIESVVELSKTRLLRNSYIISGDEGTIEVGHKHTSPVYISLRDTDRRIIADMENRSAEFPLQDIFVFQLREFYEAIVSEKKPYVDGYEGRMSVSLINRCYRVRQKLCYPWEQ